MGRIAPGSGYPARRMSWPARVGTAVLGLGVMGFAACQMLPERYAVNAPMTNALFGWGAEPPDEGSLGSRIRVPEGFSLGLYAEVPKARFLRPTPQGDLLVSVPREGQVVLLERDRDADGRADATRVLLDGLNRPHGLDLHDGWLYVGETDAVIRVRFDGETGQVHGEIERIVEGLPAGGNHWTRTLRIGPDGHLYVSVGSSCNVCFEEDERRAAMLRFDADGGSPEIFAIGLRNAVGFDWQPGTGDLYATDNGRDLLGDDFPPCELNRVVEGGDYGWPVANGDRVLDPDLGAGHEERARASIPPEHGFGAHTAPLGIAFLRHPSTPAAYRDAALAALHGSWNRTSKAGYSVVSLHFGPDGAVDERPFLTGLLEGEDVIGRPVDVAQGPDGVIFVSDDYAGVIYRVGTDGAGSLARASAPAAGAAAGAAGVTDQAAVARGAALYETHACYTCHETERAGEGLVPVLLDDLASKRTLADVVAALETPTPPMPVVPLSADEQRDLAHYLLSTPSVDGS